MSKLIKFKIFFLMIFLILIIGCKSTLKNNHNKYLTHLNDSSNILPNDYLEKLKVSSDSLHLDSIRESTSDFYDVEIISKSNKKIFHLEEQKLFSMQIINYGTKDLFLPERFRDNKDLKNVELTIEIFKKEKEKFVKYVQKKLKTDIFRYPKINNQKRIIVSTSKGQKIIYENILIDVNEKIVDKGLFKAKIYIDISNFGYFEKLETEIQFEVRD